MVHPYITVQYLMVKALIFRRMHHGASLHSDTFIIY